MKTAATFFLILLTSTAFADQALELRQALGRISSGSDLHQYDGQDELPKHMQYARFYFESRKKGFRDARALLDAGVDPNGKATAQESFLTWCAGAPDAIALLLSYKADPNQPSPGRWPRLPLNQAARQSYNPTYLRSMAVLLKAGADPEKQDGNARTALMRAAEHGAFQGVNLLLKHGANPNTQSQFGKTALMYAATRGNPRSAHALLHGGADPTLESNRGETALSLAIAYRHPQTADVIRRHLQATKKGKAAPPKTSPESKSE